MKTPPEITEELKKIKYPGYSRDIVSFGMVRDIAIDSAKVTVTLAVASQKPEIVEQIRTQVAERVRQFTGQDAEVVVQEPQSARAQAPRGPQPITGVKHVIAVASGKGGVGKSTVAANLALAIRQLGHEVGLLDADVYGPSMPLMLDLHDSPTSPDGQRITPLERYGIKVISIGLFVGAGTPVISRGPMVHKLLTQFLREVDWGELDFLILEFPPGTGDAAPTIARQVRPAGGVIVTTPQDVALLDVKRGVAMFQQVNAPVLGVIENMSYHVCTGCGHRAEIFGHGGGAAMAREFGVPFLGELPLASAIRQTGDGGKPLVLAAPDEPQSRALLAMARRVVDEARAGGAAAELPVIQ